MKKITVFSIAILFLMGIFTGCSNDSNDPPTRLESMTFVDDLSNTGREFIIYDDLYFMVKLFDEYFEQFEEDYLEVLEELRIIPGLIVTGIVKDTNDTWTSDTITGIAQDMSSNDNELSSLFTIVGIAVGIEMNYTKVNGEITAVDVSFTSGDFAEFAGDLMGGPYMRKE